ncbi:hypothetical protein QMK19_21310 [Streptomyces sp. H10-C2]|uniref:NAD-dependent epimerase/dehydratase family protein n=1 Tax=unclassified Streptomyces TaxID=2593676 RepID=UPI0024B8AC48|nr:MULTISPECIES: NAD-dependent epimerase/dehydratase family protein [unclassified Streptomyces]MDJ0345379.1 hypothetical protein [Streptomyces sp. PH10-H1]MDJ0372133.1 hypothetical protein [Streptomyces sp. H10-C2]
MVQPLGQHLAGDAEVRLHLLEPGEPHIHVTQDQWRPGLPDDVEGARDRARHQVVVTTHRRTEVPSVLAGRVTAEPLDVTDRDAFLALADRHDISDIVHLAGSIPDEDPVSYFRTDTTGLLNALDAGRAIALRTTAETLRHDTYNVSSGRPFTNRDFANALQAITPDLRLELLPGRQNGPGDDPYLDITRLTHDTGFTPAFDVPAAVADYVAWRADNPP